MSQIPKRRSIILVDYENIQNIDLSSFINKGITFKIFVGYSQDKIPFALVRSTHKMGRYVEWIKIEKNGNNSLDFYIAFYLGKINARSKNISCYILYKDKGFDSLIAYLHKKNISCQRIESLSKILPDIVKTSTVENQNIQSIELENPNALAKVIEKLTEMKQSIRPKKKETLQNHIKSMCLPQKMNDRDVEAIIDRLITNGKICVVGNKIRYCF
jgi:hypothetical protein